MKKATSNISKKTDVEQVSKKNVMQVRVLTMFYVIRGRILDFFFRPKNEVPQESVKILIKGELSPSEDTVGKNSKKDSKRSGMIWLIVCGVLFYFATQMESPWLLLLIVILLEILVAVLMGVFLAFKYLAQEKKHKLLNIFVWGNLVAWIIPLIGIFVSVFFWRIGRSNKNKTYLILSGICFFLSIIALGMTLSEKISIYF